MTLITVFTLLYILISGISLTLGLIENIKMDIRFVHGIDKRPKDQTIMMVIISLAKNLDLKLVAEDVETNSQLDFLKQRMRDEIKVLLSIYACA